jgi:protein SCO1/2
MLHPRLRLALTVAVTCAAAMVAIVTLTTGNSNSDTVGSLGPLVNGFYGETTPAAMPSANFALRDQNGKTIRLSQYSGQVVVLTFVYSTCEDTCPVVVEQIRGALNELRHRVPAIAVSVDPEQDTRKNVSAFLIKEDVLGQLEYLVAPRHVLAPIWKFFGVQPQVNVTSTKSDHTIDVLLLDKAGTARVAYTDVSQMDPDAIAHDIETLQAEPLPKVLPKRVSL